MSLPSAAGNKTDPTTSMDLNTDSATAIPAFSPERCLFCPHKSADFDDNVEHMRISHGLFVPHRQHLAVDLQTLFKYLHLVIFGYQECIHCGTQRASVQAVQQHMTGKGHCKFDISEEDSEFAEFYDFSQTNEDEMDTEDNESGNETQSDQSANLGQKPLLVDEASMRLPSGRIISRQSSAQTGSSSVQSRRRFHNQTSKRLESSAENVDNGTSKQSGSDSESQETKQLSRRERRERAMSSYQLANMRANDRASLMHLPASQQRSLLATQHRNEEKTKKEEQRNRSKIDRKGNKNLYAYWATETPVYLCG